MWKNLVTSEDIKKLNDNKLKQILYDIGNVYFSPNVINYMSDENEDDCDINDYRLCVINEEFRINMLVKLNEYLDTSNVEGVLKVINVRTNELINIFIDTYADFLVDL